MKTDRDGNQLWDFAVGTSADDRMMGLLQNADGTYTLGGHSSGGATGDKSSPNFGNKDIWIVQVSEQSPLTISCPADISVANDPGQCAAIVNFPPPVSTGGKGAVTIVCTPASGSSFPVGTTQVSCVATDSDGITATCFFAVTVTDSTPPSIVCPPDFTVIAPLGRISAVVNFSTPSAIDNCSIAAIACSPVSGSILNLGTTIINCAAIDSSGNTATCSFSVVLLSPQSAAQQLSSALGQLVAQQILNAGTANALTVKLQSAIQSMNSGNGTPAINQLNAFIKGVNALVVSGRLSASTGQALIASAQQIQSSIP